MINRKRKERGELMKYSRQKVVDKARSYLGCNEKDGSFKKIIDLYNTQNPRPRGYKLSYNDPWCAGFVSAVSIALGYTKIIPTECSCGFMIDKYKSIGCWMESDSYVPDKGDVIFYCWSDSGSGDCMKAPDHVGIVASCDGKSITVIEGNKGEKVAYRYIDVNNRYIRGFGLPKYSADESSSDPIPAIRKLPAKSDVKFTVSGSTSPNREKVFTGTTMDVLRVRTWAGVENTTCSFSPLQEDTKIDVCDSILDKDGNTWYYIRYNDRYGFVSSFYVDA